MKFSTDGLWKLDFYPKRVWHKPAVQRLLKQLDTLIDQLSDLDDRDADTIAHHLRQTPRPDSTTTNKTTDEGSKLRLPLTQSLTSPCGRLRMTMTYDLVDGYPQCVRQTFESADPARLIDVRSATGWFKPMKQKGSMARALSYHALHLQDAETPGRFRPPTEDEWTAASEPIIRQTLRRHSSVSDDELRNLIEAIDLGRQQGKSIEDIIIDDLDLNTSRVYELLGIARRRGFLGEDE